MTKLLLIRHGKTDYNQEGRYCGFSDPPLNKEGLWQVERLVLKLKDIKIDKIYCSDLKRAYQTAKIIFNHNTFEKSADFREMNFGVFEGLTYKEIIKKYPRLYRDWVNDATAVKIPKAEGLKDFTKRVNQKLSFLLTRYRSKTLALVTHAGPIRVILAAALAIDLKNFWQIEQEAGALNIIDYSHRLSPKVVKINDISHLSA